MVLLLLVGVIWIRGWRALAEGIGVVLGFTYAFVAFFLIVDGLEGGSEDA